LELEIHRVLRIQNSADFTELFLRSLRYPLIAPEKQTIAKDGKFEYQMTFYAH